GHADLRRRVDDLDTLVTERRKPIVDLVGRDDVLGHVVVYFVISKEAFGLAEVHQLLLLTIRRFATVHRGSSSGRRPNWSAMLRVFNWRIVSSRASCVSPRRSASLICRLSSASSPSIASRCSIAHASAS